MTDSPQVVYVAGNVQQAYLLKNAIEERGIQAQVYNATLEGGAGVDYVGWNTLARVVVDAADYDAARRIALEFDHAVNPADAQDYENTPIMDTWPCCPHCRTPRITHCPVCKTTGSDFSPADPEFIWGMGLDEITDSPLRQTMAEDIEDDQNHGHANPQAKDEQEEPIVLMCPICDEPFVPEFPNRCAMCGHHFADGYDVEATVAAPEQISPRAIALMVALVLLLLGVLGYFIWIVRFGL